MSSIIKQSNLLFTSNSPIKINIDKTLIDIKNTIEEKELIDDIEMQKKIIIDNYNRKKAELEGLLNELEDEVKAAKDEYNNILNEAANIKNDALKEAEGIKNAAYEEGKIKGYNEGIASANKELEKSKNKLTEEFENEKKIICVEKDSFILSIQKKIPELISMLFRANFENAKQLDEKIMQTLVLKGLSELSDEKNIRILLSEEEYDKIDKENIIKNYTNDNNVEITFSYDKKLKNGDCLIETNIGYIDAGVNALNEYLTILASENISFSNE